VRGAAFGLRQSLDTVGAVLGPLLAVALMLLWNDDVRAVFWVAVIPGVAAVAVLWLGVKEPARSTPAERTNPLTRANLRRLPRAYWEVVALGAVFMLARFSEAFLLLRAADGGLPMAWTPLVLVGMNLVYAASAYPFGRLSDAPGQSHARLLALGLVLLIAADLVLASGAGVAQVSAGVLLWGLHMGVTQGLLARLVADTAPADLRGTAYGVFNLASGVALLIASVLAGWLWGAAGPAATFLAGAVFGVLALGGVAWRAVRGRRQALG
jgi:MFS family permease